MKVPHTDLCEIVLTLVARFGHLRPEDGDLYDRYRFGIGKFTLETYYDYDSTQVSAYHGDKRVLSGTFQDFFTVIGGKSKTGGWQKKLRKIYTELMSESERPMKIPPKKPPIRYQFPF